MNNQSENEIINSIIGLGEKSIRKSYYPQLKKKLEEIEELNKNLEDNVKERTKELQEQKDIFETLFNDTSDAIALIRDEKFVDCNSAVLNLLGFKNKDSFLNIKPHEISPKYQPDGQLSEKKGQFVINECLEEGKVKFEWVHKKSNNEEFWVDVSLTKIILNNENVVHVVWRDITDKKQLEIEIKERNQELEDSNNELEASIENLKITQKRLLESEKMANLGEVVTNIAKEINTPIDIAVTSGTFLSHTLENAQADNINNSMTSEELNLLFNNSRSLCDTVNQNLTSIAKLIRYFQQIKIVKNSKEEKRTFNVFEYLHGIVLSMESKLDKNKVDIDIHCKKTLAINSTPDDFSKIITTLISNSIKYGFENKEKGNITIDVLINNNNLLIGYKDDGKGIKEEDIHKIFELFFTTGENSHGLGLSIIYNIITNKLNGNIRCTSNKNYGAMFNISIPLMSSTSKEIVYHI